MPPDTEDSLALPVWHLPDEVEPLRQQIKQLEQQLELVLTALRFYATTDLRNPAAGFVAQDVLRKLRSAKSPNAQPAKES